jgi:hypothetical protein
MELRDNFVDYMASQDIQNFLCIIKSLVLESSLSYFVHHVKAILLKKKYFM